MEESHYWKKSLQGTAQCQPGNIGIEFTRTDSG